ncbi:MAG: PAS domain S-box protein, partial [Candidatus Omnitrophica bacterium]|nr:PAS domain S-box protein [Candidatus Omnitrophota bacterium]
MFTIATSNRNRNFIKLISIALIGVFMLTGPCTATVLAEIAAAGDCIAVQSVFSPVQSRQIKHKALLKYNLACRMMAGGIDPTAERDDLRLSSDGADLEYVFSDSVTDAAGSTTVLPCRYRNERYWCVLRRIKDTGQMGSFGYDLVFYAEADLDGSDPREPIYRSRATAREQAAIERAVKSEIEHDEKIRNAIAEGSYVVINEDNSDMSLFLVFAFLDMISPELSGDLAGLVRNGQVMIVTGEDADTRLAEPHAGGQGIYIPDSERYMNARTIVHETYAKAGFTHTECIKLENMFEKAAGVLTRRRYGSPEEFRELITTDPEDKGLLKEAGYASFIDLDEILDKRDYSGSSGEHRSPGADPGTGAFRKHAREVFTGAEPVGVFETSPDGTILSSSFDVHRELGLEPKDEPARLRGMFEASLRDNWEHITEKAGSKPWLECDLTLSSELADGKRLFKIYIHLVRGIEGAKLVFAVFDVTGQTRLLSEQGFELDQLERVLAAASEGIAMLDERGHIISSNEGLSIMLGYEKARDIKGLNILDLMEDTSGADGNEILGRCLSEGVVRGEEILLRTQQRDKIVARLNAVASVDSRDQRRVTVALTDITEYRRARKELESERAVLGAFVQTSHNLMLETGLDRSINRVSPRCQEMLGHTAGEMKGKVLDDFMHPDDLEKMSEDVFGMFGSREPLSGAEYRIKKKTGEYFWADFDIDPMISETGNIEGMVFNIRDASEARVYRESLESIFQNTSAVTFDVDEDGVVIANAEHLTRFLGGDPETAKNLSLAALPSMRRSLLIRDIEEVLR